MKELVIDALIENLDQVLEFVESQLAENDCPIKLMIQIDVAVEEVFVNIANYAYKPGTGSARIRVAAGDEIVIEFEDEGVAYDPLQKEDPDITLSAEQREIGGLGVYMVKNMMDEVHYRREGNKNILTLRKRIR